MNLSLWADRAIGTKCRNAPQDDFERTKLFCVAFRNPKRCSLARFLCNWRTMNESQRRRYLVTYTWMSLLALSLLFRCYRNIQLVESKTQVRENSGQSRGSEPLTCRLVPATSTSNRYPRRRSSQCEKFLDSIRFVLNQHLRTLPPSFVWPYRRISAICLQTLRGKILPSIRDDIQLRSGTRRPSNNIDRLCRGDGLMGRFG